MIALLLALGCSGGPGADAAPPLPAPIGGASCAVCGMVVGEQPSPRAQLAHRDGEHVYFCSIGDLRAYVQAPSPRGKPVAAWVEAVPPDLDLSATAPLPWVDVDDAYFVVGFERGGVMGRPALSTSEPAAASGLAERLGARVVRWAELRDTPFSRDPELPR